MEYEWFLTLADKANIATYCHGDRRRKTLTTRLLSPVWEYAAGHIPITVAPNVITLAGFTCTLQVCLLSCKCCGERHERLPMHLNLCDLSNHTCYVLIVHSVLASVG